MVSFCVFHLVCFLCTAPYSRLPPYTCFLSLFFALRIFPLSFPLNTVLEIIHSTLFWQFLLNFKSHVQLQRPFCCVSGLGLILFGCLQSYSCCHFFNSLSLQLFSEVSPTLYSLVYLPRSLLLPTLLLITAWLRCRAWDFQVAKRLFTFHAALATL